ncbi:MAG: vanadium-dependent haloperoxidase [Gammaproteobacteria bacterium]|nr:vanadium-dependent haloperoxidase [Gammaproteobacteria bacterium]
MITHLRSTFAAFILVTASLSPGAAAAFEGSNGDVIVEWNQLLQTNISGLPVSQPHNYAMLQIAMADAVVAIHRRYRPFHAHIAAPAGASAEAAAAQAGHDILVTLFPASQAVADTALANRLAQIDPGRAALGVQVGKQAAAAILAWRQNDGYAGANPQPPAVLASTLPGIWVPTATGPYQFSLIYHVTPFALLTPFQFLPPPHPQLESPEYATAFNEVKDVGRSNSTVRTLEQGRFAQLFAGVGAYANVTSVFRIWSNVARDVSQSNSLSLVDTARLYAMMWASMHDSILTSHSSKAVYLLWRPETAIAHADIDNNPATDAEPGWTPLIPTPPYPAYSSDMTCLATGASRMLAHVLGSDAQSFTATWYTKAGTVVFAQPYNSLWSFAVDEANSRVWGGIHYRFDIEASQASCTQVADYVFDNFMQPRGDD